LTLHGKLKIEQNHSHLVFGTAMLSSLYETRVTKGLECVLYHITKQSTI